MVWYCTSCEGENVDESYTCEHCGYVYYDSSFYDYEYQQGGTEIAVPKVPTKK
jgi:hypothetical protein